MDVASQLFDLGKTYYQGNTIDVSSTYANVGGKHLEGTPRVFKWRNRTDPIKLDGADDVVAILVRNVSGYALLPGRLVTWKTAFHGKRVDGYTRLTACQVAGVVDPYLGAAGVPDGDLFWLVVRGPCLVYSNNSDLAENLAEGDILYAITAATSAATGGLSTGGKFTKLNTAGTATSTATTDGSLANILINQIGRARSTSLTTNTNSLVLVDLRLR